MANIIDISAKLTSAVPQLKFSEDEIYEINDDKNAILEMQAEMEKTEGSIEVFSQIFNRLLGEEAVKQIEKNHPGATTRFSQMIVIAVGIMAGINNMSYEDAEKQFFRTEE